MITTTAPQAYENVLANAGARIPGLDAVDKRILEEVKRGEGKIVDCVSASELTSPISCATRAYLSPEDYSKYGISDPLDELGWPILMSGSHPRTATTTG